MSTGKLDHSRETDSTLQSVEKAKRDLRVGIRRLEALVDDAWARLDPEDKSWPRRGRSGEPPDMATRMKSPGGVPAPHLPSRARR